MKADFLKAVKRLLYIVNKTNDCFKMRLNDLIPVTALKDGHHFHKIL